VYRAATGVRYEEKIAGVRIWNVTFGRAVEVPFRAAEADASVLDVRNTLLLGASLPREASGPSNLAVPASAFVNAASHNYQLAAGSRAIDAGVAIAQVTTDRQGTKRPQGKGFDIGAYERISGAAGSSEIVLYASKAPLVSGNWYTVAGASAAGGTLLKSRNDGAPMLQKALSTPVDYFEMTFPAEAGRPYRLWIRGRAYRDRPANDSVFVQFNNSVDASGRAAFRIGSTSATAVNIEDCTGCGLSGWGWQDNGWGEGVLGPLVYFDRTGTQKIRVQIREDGLSIDQIVLSSSDYLTVAPGRLKGDSTILPESIF
jgi:hypothetical protein